MFAGLCSRRGYFYPRSPCGERPGPFCPGLCCGVFLSTLSLRRATTLLERTWTAYLPFLSTLSLRRATSACLCPGPAIANFYPRSPCGERRKPKALKSRLCVISIHALLAESDFFSLWYILCLYISIHALLAESDWQRGSRITYVEISIHALLAESDTRTQSASLSL